jgi:carbonic anhydrase
MRRIAFACVLVLLALQGDGGFGRPLQPRRRLLSEGNFHYAEAGKDWPDDFPDCAGKEQSPININTTVVDDDVHGKLSARIDTFGTADLIKVKNTGQSVQVTFEVAGTNVVLPVTGGKVAAVVDPIKETFGAASIEGTAPTARRTISFAKVTLAQFHFHISSENAIDGVLYPMEAHMVTIVPKEEVEECGDAGCVVVFGVLFTISDEDNDFLEPLFEAAPTKAGDEHAEAFPKEFTMNLDDLFPATRGFYTWPGSFTTPPCTEGVLWVLFDSFSTVSSKQLTKLQSKMSAVHTNCIDEAKEANDAEAEEACKYVGDVKNNRELQPVFERLVEHVSRDDAAPAS